MNTSPIRFAASRLWLGVAVALALALVTPLPRAASAATDDLFEGTNLLHLTITIPDEGIRTLERPRGRRGSEPKPKAEATVTDGQRVFTNVTVQLKGFTTYEPISGLPSLTLNFDKLAPDQKFHGLTKISLNNSLQDATRLHEKLSRELFAAAGVPVARADYALVTLNGRRLGLYVLTEGFDKHCLKRHFPRPDGNLYEGGVLKDIDQPLQLSPGRDPTNHAGVERLIAAARETDPDTRWRALNAALDLDRFLSMMAMETLLCHSDSYSMNRNNYRLYHDPATDKMVFMPHGMDRVLGTHRSPLHLPIVPPTLGLVARAVLSVPEGRRRHLERVGTLFTNLFDPDRLCRRVRELEARIATAKTDGPADGRFSKRPGASAAQDADNLCERLAGRAAEVKLQLTHAQDLRPAPTPAFNTEGIASLTDWTPRRSAAQPEPNFEMKAEAGVLHLRSTNQPLGAWLRSRVTLPAGNYRLAGAVHPTNAVTVFVRRYSTSRFELNERRMTGNELKDSFQVTPAGAPEEIEFLCHVQHESGETRFDPRSLKLIDDQQAGKNKP